MNKQPSTLTDIVATLPAWAVREMAMAMAEDVNSRRLWSRIISRLEDRDLQLHMIDYVRKAHPEEDGPEDLVIRNVGSVNHTTKK